MIQPVLHLHVCADPAPTELAAAGVDSAVEPLHYVANYATDSTVVGAALTETS
jgi:hypothetical protein